MKRTMALFLAASMGIAPAGASPGVTTADVNFRAGPSTGEESFGVLPEGTPVDIGACDGSGWCAISVDGVGGYVSGQYVAETDPPPEGDAAPAEGGEPGALSEAELDQLVAPYALYPDPVLAQVLVAVTVPLDVVKAERWIDDNADLEPEKRADATTAEGWDESVAALAAGFPSVIEQLGADLDGTEALGDAVILDTDAVLAAVQRQRARAQAVGNLADNEAQLVTIENNEITITPAEPAVVYVPTYDPVTIYTEPAPAAPVYVETGSGYDAGAVLATGAMSFAAGYAISSVFDNDWDDYWRGPPRIDWNDNYFYPRPGYRPGVDINGNVNIGNDINIGNGTGNRPGWNGDRPVFGGNRPGDRPGSGWRPSERQRDDARQKLANRTGGGSSIDRRPGNIAATGKRPDRAALESKLKASSGGGKIAKAAPGGAGAAARKAGGSSSAFSGQKSGGLTKSKAASNRGKSSIAAKSKPKAAAQHAATKRVSKPKAVRAPTRKAAPKRTAFNKPARSRPAAASKARGSRSMGHRGGGGRRGGRR